MKYRILATAVIGASVVLSGCNRKAEGQTVAVVNGEEITLPDLNFALGAAKIPDNADKAAVRNQVLQQLIDRRLLVEQAKKEGVDKTPEFLNRERRAEEDLLISMMAARRLNTSQLPSDSDVQAYITAHPGAFANRETWSLDQVVYPTPTDKGIIAELQATHGIDAIIAVLQKHNIRFVRQKNQLDTALVPPDLYSKVAGLPAGEPFIVPVGDRSVASSITAKEPHPLTGDDAKPVAVTMIRKTTTTKSLQDLLKSLRGQAKIDYQPGFAPKS